jgi:tRNA (guanine10-N2)-dimethyltransferase
MPMRLLFLLSGEHPELPRQELFAVLQGEGIKFKKTYERGKDRLLVLEINSEDLEFRHRLGMVRKVAIFIGISKDISKLGQMISPWIGRGTFAVRSTQDVAKKLGRELKGSGLKVNLESPDSTVLCFKDGEYLAAIEIPLEREFNSRKPQSRPYSHPTSLHPKLARTLVNLARLRPGKTLLDPFCGTGGILIEAALMGIKVLGSDISQEMVNGCKRNLEFYGLGGDLRRADALEISKEFHPVDGIVTDPPYGRSSFISNKNLGKFYEKFLLQAEKVLKSGKFLIISLPREFKLKIDGFRIVDKFSFYIHKSLTRRIYVLRKI